MPDWIWNIVQIAMGGQVRLECFVGDREKSVVLSEYVDQF